MNLGSRLEEILKSRNMTVTQLAREAEVSPQTLYAMIRRDSNKVDMNIMARILMALEMDLVEFVQLEAPEKKPVQKRTHARRDIHSVEEENLSPRKEKQSAGKEDSSPEEEIRPRQKEMETYLL